MDFFCGAGGFSEGFRQEGFEIKYGVDNWAPAICTFNFNYGLNCDVQDILEFERSEMLIHQLPDTEIIIGSPPCVSFSNSNKSGKADKSMGLRLTEAFLRVVAIKKFQQNSKLVAWFMENVSNSIKYLPSSYTFKDLNLSQWAKENNLRPESIAIQIEGNYAILNSAHYGSAQQRKRAFAGEIVEVGSFILPDRLFKTRKEEGILPIGPTLKDVKNCLPRPNSKKSYRKIMDPMYSDVHLSLGKLTDHFYDSGLYFSHWRKSRSMKRNHPFMGRMAFPENENNPSRTITATNIGTSREAIIYKSEYKRSGDGEYRVPTVREMASLMGFPITYQFVGNTVFSKCRLVGNAVCPHVSSAIARKVLEQTGKKVLSNKCFQIDFDRDKVKDLNTFEEKEFNNPPVKNKGSKFRDHPFKYGNITVTLSNYDIESKNSNGKWITSVQYGNGEGYPTSNYEDHFYRRLEDIIKGFENGNNYISLINNGFSEKIANAEVLQTMYEKQESDKPFLEPTDLVQEIARIIDQFEFEDPVFNQEDLLFFKHKRIIPKKQVLALYAINKVTSIANSNDREKQ